VAIADSQRAALVGTNNGISIASSPTVRLRICNKSDAARIARLHSDNISNGFGIPLLEAYYKACLTSQNSFCLCAEVDGAMAGYVGVISDRAELLRIALRRESMAVLRCILQHPVFFLELIRHAWNWMRFSLSSRSQVRLPSCEYRPVVVAKPYRGRHIAQMLLATAEDLLRSKGIKQVHLRVSPENASALHAYEHAGFQRVGQGRQSPIFMLKTLGLTEPQ
jgi:GNAT superfamily N-acetyltransferase